jgi:phosphoribosylformylglycinamidine synthase
MDVDVGAVPRREEGMAPWEVMTSESQERMLAIVAPGDWPAVAEVCSRWEVRASVVGVVTDAAGRLRIRDGLDGPVLADVPAASLADDAPLYDRPAAPPADLARRRAERPAVDGDAADWCADLLGLLADTSWVYRQYDHQLFLNTVEGPGGDAALLRLAGPGLPASPRGLAVSTDSSPRWCAIDPRAGTAMVVAEGVLNLACVGARAVAVVNCLNFGNPEHPEVMWQLSEAVDGLAEACTALGLPVIGGNVSLYNESAGADIDPTPVIGTLGLLEVLAHRPPGIGWTEGATVIVLGRAAAPDTAEPHPLGGSRWAVERRGRRGGALAPLDLTAHRRLVDLVAALVTDTVAGGDGPLCGVHDVSAGGLGVALAEMAVRSGTGLVTDAISGPAQLFSELASRVLVATHRPDQVTAAAAAAGVPVAALGVAGGDRLVAGGVDLALGQLTAAFEGALPTAVGGGVEEAP